MQIDISTTKRNKGYYWTPRLIRQLRGKRTQTEFGRLLGAPKNTVWRWEAGRVKPDAEYVEKLNLLAERECFLNDWKLVGSMTLIGDLENTNAEIAAIFARSLERSANRLVE